MDKSKLGDPFVKARESSGLNPMDDQGDALHMVLRLQDVRRCAKNWQTFSSEAQPGRIVVPSEVGIRSTRQIPFELDPPLHTVYRAMMESWFRRPLQEGYQMQLKQIATDQIKWALSQDNLDVVEQFALPLQSRALTLLLNVPITEAELWISWGTHVFRSEQTALDADKAGELYDYIDQRIDQAMKRPGEDMFSTLLAAQAEGRKLSREEVKGAMILTFAGGRDTVINAITNTLAYLAEHPDSLSRLKTDVALRRLAIEELVRYFSPLTHMGRVATEDASICEMKVKEGERISLCWASANRDENVFTNAQEIVLDRKMNPHVGFGFAHHKCLGAHHARQILLAVLDLVCEYVSEISIQDHVDNIEEWGDLQRKVGFKKLVASFR